MLTKKVCTRIRIATLCIINLNLKWPQCPLIGIWVSTVVSHNGNYPAVKRNKPQIPVTAWKNLKSIITNNKSQTQKITHCMVPFT